MKTPITWSAEQQSIFRFAKSGTGHLIVEAFAGTGKTTTIVEMFKHAPERRMLYAVFNKRNQKEAEAKITDDRVDVRTLHSLGFMYIRNVWRNAKPDSDVEEDRIERALAGRNIPMAEVGPEVVKLLCRLVSFAKNTTLKTTRDDLEAICEQYQLDFEGCGFDAFQAVLDALEESKVQDREGRISFDDMVWLPVAMGWVRQRYGLVVIDEAQDMNLPQLMMARAASSGRVIVVGDRRQAIYGFRGAATGGMSMMKGTLRAAELKLTTTYRCPKAVVAVANEVVPEYRAAAIAPEGLVNQSGRVDDAQIGDSILSRLNAPLMPLALQLIRAGKPARVEGRDVGKQLLSLVRAMRAKSVPNFIEKVEAWLKKQTERLKPQKKSESRIEQARDIAETLKAVAEGCKGTSEIETRINSMFQDTDENSKPAIVLSSVHKAKGLEWGRVFLLTSTFRKGRGDEEDNIYYVAVTRAMRELHFVGAQTVSKSDTSGRTTPAQFEVIVNRLTTPILVAAAVHTAKHKISTDGDSCDCGCDTALCQKCGVVFCGSLTKWVNGVGNVCHKCSPPLVHTTQNLDDYDLPQGMTHHKLGNVIRMRKVEQVCVFVNYSRAGFMPLQKLDDDGNAQDVKSAQIEYISSTCDPADILRTMPKEQLQIFLDRAAGKSKEEKQTKQPAAAIETKTTMSKIDKHSKAGSAQFFRDQVAAGVSKKTIFEQAVKKWPALEGDQAGLESRFETATRIAQSAKAAAKSGKSQAKPAPKKNAKPAKTAKPAKAAAKLPQPPAVPARPASVPPPRPEVAA